MAGSSPATVPASYYVVHVVDDVDASATGRQGCQYMSTPHAAAHALELVRALLGCPTPTQGSEGPWCMPVAAGQRTVTIQPVDRDGQLTLETTSAHA